MRDRYWGSADVSQARPPDTASQAQVNAHLAPDGYNEENNPRLDRLFRMLDSYPSLFTHRYFVALLAFIDREMSDADRGAARASSLVNRLAREKIGNVVERMVVQGRLGILPR